MYLLGAIYTMFLFVAIGAMLVITLLSLFLSGEYFSKETAKRAQRKMIAVNIIIMIVFAAGSHLALSNEYAGMLIGLAVMWYMLQILLALSGILVKLFRTIYEKSSGKPIDPSRRRFLRGLIWVPAISGALYGGLYERRHIEFTQVDIDASSAPKLNGMKIAQLTDVHLGNFFSTSQLQAVLTQIVQKSPDMLVLTGDIFDSQGINDEAIKVIDSFTGYFPFGTYMCWGNHEHIRGIEHLREALSNTNIKVLNNASVKILSGDRPFYLLGVDYVGGVDDNEDSKTKELRRSYLEEAMAHVPDNAYKILLAHHPIFFDEAFSHHIELTLSGHTHGGQFGILGHPIFSMFKYMRGRFEQDGCIGYVSRGAGSWFPYRIGCPPEITVFNFTAKG